MRITLTIIGCIIAIAATVVLYFWIKSTILNFLTLCYILHSRILDFFSQLKLGIIAPFIALYNTVLDFLDLQWLINPFNSVKHFFVNSISLLWTFALGCKDLFITSITFLCRLTIWTKDFLANIFSALSGLTFSTSTFLSNTTFSTPTFLSPHSWNISQLQKPHWLNWLHSHFHISEKLQKFFFACAHWVEKIWELMRPDGVTLAEEVSTLR